MTGTLSASSIAAMSLPVKKSCFWLHAVRRRRLAAFRDACPPSRVGSPSYFNRTYRGMPRLYEEPGYAQPASIVSSHSGSNAGLLAQLWPVSRGAFFRDGRRAPRPSLETDAGFLESKPPEASVETPAAREPAKLPPKKSRKTQHQVLSLQHSLCAHVAVYA